MPALDPQTALLATIGFPVDPQTIAPIALAAAAVWLLFGDKIRSAWGTWGDRSGGKTGGDLMRLVSAADLLVRHFDEAGDDEGSQAARTAAGRLFAARPEAKP
jgi:hypothetical protein